MPIRLSGLASGLDTENIVSELMSAQRLKATKIENKKTKLEWKKEKWQDLNKKLYSFYTGSLNNMKMQGSFNTKSATTSNPNKVAVTAGNSAVEGSHQIKVSQLASAQFVTGAKLGSDVNASTTLSSLGVGTGDITITNGAKSKTLTVDGTTKVSDLVSAMTEAGLNASFDNVQKRLYLSSKGSGTDSSFSMSAASGVDLSKVGLSSFQSTNGDGSVALSGGGSMAFVAAKNATFEYNGSSMTSSTNSIAVNGLTFNLLATTGSETVSINVKKDTEAVYEKIKGFVKEYNGLIAQMNEFYHAGTAKGFEPLTDEEKESMTEDQIEKWETKIKDSLLRRDNTLSTLLGTMRSEMSRSTTYNGKSYSLASFGVVTADYTEKGLLHINGDKDDSTVSSLKNDLMKALNENPEAVMETFTKLAGNLYTSFTDSMKSNSLRSALTFYNDKEMKKQIDDYKEDLSTLEDKLADIENRYYKQFTAMEKAMSNMNAKSNSLASMLGTGS